MKERVNMDRKIMIIDGGDEDWNIRLLERDRWRFVWLREVRLADSLQDLEICGAGVCKPTGQ